MVLFCPKRSDQADQVYVQNFEFCKDCFMQRKGFSFFKVGMKPVVFSLKRHRRTGNGWERRADNVSYGVSPICDRIKNSNSKLYALEFELEF